MLQLQLSSGQTINLLSIEFRDAHYMLDFASAVLLYSIVAVCFLDEKLMPMLSNCCCLPIIFPREASAALVEDPSSINQFDAK